MSPTSFTTDSFQYLQKLLVPADACIYQDGPTMTTADSKRNKKTLDGHKK
jgi:hypothetical protein